MEKSKKKKYLVIGMLFTIIVMIGSSFAWWTSTAEQQGMNQIQSDCLSLILENESDAIHLEKAYPITDEEAQKLTPYSFTIKNKCNTTLNFSLKLEKLKESSENEKNILDSKYVAVELNGGQKQILSEYPSDVTTYSGDDYTSIEAKDLMNGTLKGQESREFKLKLWMDEDVTVNDDAMNKNFISKIVVDGKMNTVAEYTEPILHGADPVLETSSKPVAMLTANEIAEEPTTNDKLIPVIIDDTGKVTKANTKEEWYNYEEKEWANAVILVDNTKEYKEGDTIPEDNIESYFVWIPKYKYKIFNMGEYTDANGPLNENAAQTIEIKFDLDDTENTETSCETPNASGEDGSCAVDKWMTHPAFTAFEGSKGMWVGKFETGYKDANSTTEAQKDESNSSKVIIKPNVYSWRGITVKNMFDVSYAYQRELDSHMMKNTEWGAVAYLSHSKYGICTDGICTEIMINNSQNFVTGYAAIEMPTSGYTEYNGYDIVTPNQDNGKSYNYKNKKSNVASTTGNYSGIYDMSGGAFELVTGYMNGNIWSSDLVEENEKYYDAYEYSSVYTTYNKRILGDATGELGPFGLKKYSTSNNLINSWNESWARFIGNELPWFMRGGESNSGIQANIFAFSNEGDSGLSKRSFRIVLTPINN